MNGHAPAACDIAYYIVSGQRRAAAGKAHHHSGVALHYHALAVAAVLRPALLLLLKPLQALCGSRRLSLLFCLLKKLVCHLPGSYAAVAYRGIYVVQIGHIELF